MSVNILIITHDDVGNALLQATKSTFGELPLSCKVIRIERGIDPDKVIRQLKKTIQKTATNDGVLILTDVFGSTPSNIAQALHDNPQTRLIAGLNLPMLIRIMNYPNLNLNELANKALTGGREGVIDCEKAINTQA